MYALLYRHFKTCTNYCSLFFHFQYPAQATTLLKFHATEWFVAPTAFVIATVERDTDASAMVLVAGLALQLVRDE